MTAFVPSSKPPANRPTWGEIEQVVAEFAQLARTELSLAAFAEAWLRDLLHVLPASGGMIWQLVSHDAPGKLLASAGIVAADHTTLAVDVQTLSPTSIHRRRLGEREIMQAVVSVGEHGALSGEIILIDPLSTAEIEAAQRLMTPFNEIVEEFLLRHELRNARDQSASQRSFEQFVLRIHASLDPLTTAYAVANDGRAWLGCSRVIVARWRNKAAQVLAISGVDTIDQRAEEVRCLRELATVSARMGEPLDWSGGNDEHLPPQLASALRDCLDRSHAKRVAVIPLCGSPANSPVIAVLIAQWLDDGDRAPSVTDVARHSAVALARAFEHDMPLMPVLTALGKLRTWLAQRAVWVSLLAFACATVVLALVFIPADFTVEARGTLQPRLRRHLFAPADAVVEQVDVEHGDEVKKGAELLKLRDAQLEFEFRRVTGEWETSQSKLATIRARRSSRNISEIPRDEEQQLAAEEEQLKQKIRGLSAQLEVLEAMRADLRVISPLNGQVLTWHARDLLESRPVKRGQLLLTLADPTGDWVLELHVPDGDMGHVLEGRRREQEALPVTFLLATDPSQTHIGEVESVAFNSESLDGESASALVTVRLENGSLVDSRAGAGVMAKIHCGKRPLGYVWLHDLLDAVRARWQF